MDEKSKLTNNINLDKNNNNITPQANESEKIEDLKKKLIEMEKINQEKEETIKKNYKAHESVNKDLEQQRSKFGIV